ncbi:MAG: NADPH-dependent F420 reductase [Armatimonadota bacterium]|nr:NADPH-dependent F420 reductase [Armatimonadota bacterium]MDR7519797.1 NADPH-dependent F420 reductase [Armatimonadota bacterium]
MTSSAAEVRPTPETIAILGGTGNLGLGLSARLCAAGYDVVIGSRDAARGEVAARRLNLPNARGATNAEAARAASIVIVACPAEGHAALVSNLAGLLAGRIVVDATVPMAPGYVYAPPAAGSAAAETRMLAPGARVVAAFHTLSARLLADLSRPLDQDVLVCGDDPEARARIIDLANAIGARGVDAGDLAAAATIEALAVLVIGLTVRYRRRDLGIRIAHLPAHARPRP